MTKKSKKVKEVETIEKQNVEIVTLDNKPVSPFINDEKEIVDSNFVPNKNLKQNNIKKDKILTKNGRVYKELNNGIGMYADNGECFKLEG